MYPDIDATTQLLKQDKIWLSVKNHIQEYNDEQVSWESIFFKHLLLFTPPSSLAQSGFPLSTA